MGMHQMLGPSFGASEDYEIKRSLRFNDADTAYLGRTPSSASSGSTKATYSMWVKGADFAGKTPLFSASSSGGSESIEHRNDGTLVVFFDEWVDGAYYTTATFRDPSAWYHFVFAIDTTLATAADRVKIYVNGVQVSTTSSPSVAQNFSLTGINQQNKIQYIGRTANTSGGQHHYADAYYTEIHMIDGQALGPSEFGENNNDNNWIPKEYDGTYGNNGFFLKFEDNSSNAALGTDSSGNSNNFTVTNITAREEKWSNYLTSTASFTANQGPDKAFDNSLSGPDVPYNDSSVGMTWAPPGGLAYSSKVEIYVGAISGFTYSLNGASAVSATINSWNTVATGSGTINTLVFDRSSGETHGPHAIRVDNVVLVDGTASNTDSLIDTPTNYEADSGNNGGNYCTWNPLAKGSNMVLKNGNLDIDTTTGRSAVLGTIGMSSGKWYWETTINKSSDRTMVAIGKQGMTLSNAPGQGDALGWGYYADGGSKRNGGTSTSYGAGFAGGGDVIGCAFDADNGTLTFYKNGSSQGVAFTGLTDGPYFPATGDGSGVNTARSSVNFGQRPFAYTPPTGHKSLCTQNLPDPTIADGSSRFDVKLWTGNGSTQSITGYNFSPDFAWIKSRNFSTDHALFDAVRGATKRIRANQYNAENTDTNTLTAFNSYGFSLGSSSAVNYNTKTFVGWAWDAGDNSSKTYTVKVVSDSGNKYRFDDFGSSAVTLELEEGSTYVFDQSDSSNAGHPLRFSTTSNGTHGGGTEYTTGVTITGTPGQAGAKTTIVVAASAPTLYYYCGVHSGMGGQANTNSTAGASNLDGSIQAVVRANPSAGFSIVTYTGTGSNATIGHGLNAAPGLVIVKKRSAAGSWTVWHEAFSTASNTDYIYLDSNTQRAQNGSDAQPFWNNTVPTNNVVSLGTGGNVNGSSATYVAYCFAPVEGYSAFGSYTGNGSTDGTFVFTGMRAAWVMVKRTDAGAGNWTIVDNARNTHNASDKLLFPNLADSEATTTTNKVDLTSNGFKLRGAGGNTNASGGTYIYAAFAEHPFKTARAR